MNPTEDKEALLAEYKRLAEKVECNTFGSEAESEFLPQYVHEDETVECASNVITHGGNSLLALTDQRLLFIHKGLFSGKVTAKEIPLAAIRSLDVKDKHTVTFKLSGESKDLDVTFSGRSLFPWLQAIGAAAIEATGKQPAIDCKMELLNLWKKEGRQFNDVTQYPGRKRRRSAAVQADDDTPPARPAVPEPDPTVVRRLTGACNTGEIITVIYNGGSAPGTAREIVPLRMLSDAMIMVHDVRENIPKHYYLWKIVLPAPGQTVQFKAEAPAVSADNTSVEALFLSLLPRFAKTGMMARVEDGGIGLYPVCKNGRVRVTAGLSLEYSREDGRARPWSVWGKDVSSRQYKSLQTAAPRFCEVLDDFISQLTDKDLAKNAGTEAVRARLQNEEVTRVCQESGLPLPADFTAPVSATAANPVSVPARARRTPAAPTAEKTTADVLTGVPDLREPVRRKAPVEPVPLSDMQGYNTAPETLSPKRPIRYRTWFITLIWFLCNPIAYVLIFMNPYYTRKVKIFWAVMLAFMIISLFMPETPQTPAG